MEELKEFQIKNIENYIFNNARDIEKAKWNYLFNNGNKKDIVSELVKYQNDDGGFGNGLEADNLLPASTSIASTEAILIAYDYDLHCDEGWFEKLLMYFEKTIRNTPSFWEKVPKEVENFPHAPWWNYAADTKFTPNPCAVVASAFIKYGNDAQRTLGNKIAARCIEFLKSEEECSDHDCYCLQRLFRVLKELNSTLIDDASIKSMERRILECLCTDEDKWMEYVSQPLDLVTSPKSDWYKLVKPFIEKNFLYWINTLKEDGYWNPNFSWGVDSEIARNVTEIWKGYITVKIARVFKAFKYIS
ncbi:hypothetical protein [Clostridium sp.]|uniref:hypothetical protein n=1 Tax=Clostridium sp. TaxID=1506 RepID=UPI0028454F9B|nr:hypothetical protein [Clostridium sp.]MDR3597224.1 hypothetical protein [Clostridium sp.]